MEPDASPSELMFTWVSKKVGVMLRAPLHWEVKDLQLEVGATLPGLTPCIIFYDRYGYILPNDTAQPASGEEGFSGEGVLELSPRSISIVVQDLTAPTTLRDLCKSCLKAALTTENVKEVDGNDSIREINVGKKTQTALTLCGRPAFRFSYSAHGSEWEGSHVFGTVDGDRAVIVTLKTTSEDVYESLPGYTDTLLEPHLKAAGNFALFPPEAQPEVSEDDKLFDRAQASGMVAKWELGVLSYRNATAAIAFRLPAYPLQFKLGSSIIMANARQNIFNVTIVLKVLPPADPSADDDLDHITRTQQPVEISLGIDIEDIVRAHRSTIMSAAEYGSTKLKAIMSEFTNTKPSGAPLTNYIGNRSGVSYLWTGHLSTAMSSKFYKAMCCVTLSSNKGIVVSYFTRTGQGLFDMNLHIMQDLLKDIYFIPEREADGDFSLPDAVSVRLMNAGDFEPTFTNKPAQMNRYVYLAGCSTNGEVAGFDGAPMKITADGARAEEEAPVETSRRKKDRGKNKTAAAVVEEEADSLIDVSDVAWIQRAFNTYDEYPDDVAKAEGDGEAGADPDAPPAAAGEGGEADEGAPHAEDGAADPASPAAGTEGVDEAGGDGDDDGQEEAGFGDPEGGGVPGEEREDPTSPAGALSPQSAQTDGEEGDEVTGVSLYQIYQKACARRGVKPNSRFSLILPQDSLYDHSLHDLDLSLSYFGKGFAAVVYLFKFTPNLHTIAFNNMSLTNDDVATLCAACLHLPNLRALELAHNPHISLASARPLLNLAKRMPTLRRVDLTETAMGPDVVGLIRAELQKNELG
eukprot:TRINITY_DN19488_c0_g1_i1.p1 TRINITY_DN19488_c0_g1~~TRINITY_DN19488_c0_g1_i1.p1  ORF type:complete len:829 (+),score=296.75 TRINITY_DN19488_c0_g1_i1:79-2487(+)